jgi:hypothetical protein
VISEASLLFQNMESRLKKGGEGLSKKQNEYFKTVKTQGHSRR